MARGMLINLQDDVNTNADRDDRDRASTQLDQDMRSPSPPQGVSPAAYGAPPAGGGRPTGEHHVADRFSHKDEIRVRVYLINPCRVYVLL